MKLATYFPNTWTDWDSGMVSYYYVILQTTTTKSDACEVVTQKQQTNSRMTSTSNKRSNRLFKGQQRHLEESLTLPYRHHHEGQGRSWLALDDRGRSEVASKERSILVLLHPWNPRGRTLFEGSWLLQRNTGSVSCFTQDENFMRRSYNLGNGWIVRRWTGWVRTWASWRPWRTSNRTLLQHWLIIIQLIWWKASLWLISHTSAKNQHLRNLTRANQTGAENSWHM